MFPPEFTAHLLPLLRKAAETTPAIAGASTFAAAGIPEDEASCGIVVETAPAAGCTCRSPAPTRSSARL